MLQVPFIRDNQELVLEGLAKRNFANAKEIIGSVIEADETRRKIQVLLDDTLAESNALSKEIGVLFKTGQVQKATLVKEKTGKLKEQSKGLTDQLNTASKDLQELLYQIPNIPHAHQFLQGNLKKTMKRFLEKERFLSFTVRHYHIGN